MVTCDLRGPGYRPRPFVGIGRCTPSPSCTSASRCSSCRRANSSVPLPGARDTLGEANGLVLATSYGALPLAAARSGADCRGGVDIPHGSACRPATRPPDDIRVLLRARVFLFSALMIARPANPGTPRERPEHIALLRRASGRDSRTSFSTAGSARSPTGSWCRCSAAGCSSRSASRSSTRRCTGRTRSSAGWRRSGGGDGRGPGRRAPAGQARRIHGLRGGRGRVWRHPDRDGRAPLPVAVLHPRGGVRGDLLRSRS